MPLPAPNSSFDEFELAHFPLWRCQSFLTQFHAGAIVLGPSHLHRTLSLISKHTDHRRSSQPHWAKQSSATRRDYVPYSRSQIYILINRYKLFIDQPWCRSWRIFLSVWFMYHEQWIGDFKLWRVARSRRNVKWDRVSSLHCALHVLNWSRFRIDVWLLGGNPRCLKCTARQLNLTSSLFYLHFFGADIVNQWW